MTSLDIKFCVAWAGVCLLVAWIVINHISHYGAPFSRKRDTSDMRPIDWCLFVFGMIAFFCGPLLYLGIPHP